MKSIRYARILIVAILCVSIFTSLTACNEKEYIPPNAQKYQYNYYPGTDWGMTEQEVMKSLGLKEKEITNVKIPGSTDPELTCFSIQEKIFGYPATVEFYFYHIKISETREVGLESVKVKFKDDFDAKKIKSFLKTELKKQGNGFVEDPSEEAFPDLLKNEYKSKGTVKQLNDEAVTKKLVDAFDFAYGGLGRLKLDNIPFSSVLIDATVNNECVIKFKGEFAAMLNNMK